MAKPVPINAYRRPLSKCAKCSTSHAKKGSGLYRGGLRGGLRLFGGARKRKVGRGLYRE
jgi:hypothetical protein